MQLKHLTSLKKGQPGILHNISPSLLAFEYTKGSSRTNTLVFVGGLGDGLGTVDYINDIIRAVEGTDWTVFTLILSSSYGGWGMGRLGQDTDELAACVNYIREYKEPHFGAGKIVLMGHSTGSQDLMHYINAPNPRPAHPILDHSAPVTRPPVDGVIMQASVSDREGILWEVKVGTERNSPAEMREIYERAVAGARRTFEDGVDTLVPLSLTSRIGYGTTALSSRRFLSLASPDSPETPAEDDYFSSDLSDARLAETFGMIGARGLLRMKLLVLYSGRDQSVPPWVNKENLLRRWQGAVDAGGQLFWDPRSMVIPGASHALSDPDQAEPRRILVDRVTTFLKDIQK